MSRDYGRGSSGSGRKGRGTGNQSGRGSSSRDTLLAAVALQDHIARTMRMPGGPKAQPSIQPGAEMTLAQHLGLVPRPPPLLSESEWNEVHLKARVRQHSTDECPICQEAFKQDPQVLLSCSHVFHCSCLTSFERYARSRCCPLCRAVQYQKRAIQDGAAAFKHRCATRIQAAVRGWLARRRVKDMRRHRPPADPRLRRAWAVERLHETATQELADMAAERGDVDALFAELDASLALSRALCSELEGPTARRIQQQLQAQEAMTQSLQSGTAAPSSYADTNWAEADDDNEEDSEQKTMQLRAQLGHSLAVGTQTQTIGPAGGAIGIANSSKIVQEGTGGVDWDSVVARAKARGHSECPICIGRLNRRGSAGIAWLSCSHCFHLECITAFEAYELSAGGAPTCPVCRASYQRRCFQ